MFAFTAALARHSAEQEVAFAGDWHGQLAWAQDKVRALAASNIRLIFQVGDFGLWPGNRGKKFLYRLNRLCEELDVDIVVTLGNHEEWTRVLTLWENPKRQNFLGEPQPLQIQERLWILPRPYRFEHQGVSFVSLGGAASVDFEDRTRNRDWWPEEMVTWAHVEEATKAGPADVLITHETPNPPYCVPAVEQILHYNPEGFSRDALAYSKISRNRITAAMVALQPKRHFHGHMHAVGERHFWLPEADHRTTVVSLDKDMEAGNLYRLNLQSLSRKTS